MHAQGFWETNRFWYWYRRFFWWSGLFRSLGFTQKHYQSLGEKFAKCELWFYDRVVDEQAANARSRFMDIGWESGWSK